MTGRIQQIVVKVMVSSNYIERATVAFGEKERDIFANNLETAGIGGNGISVSDPVYFVKDEHKEQFCPFLTNRVSQRELWKTVSQDNLAMAANGWKIQVEDMAPIGFHGVILNLREERDEEVLNIVSNRVAELILSGFVDEDLIIFGDQLERFKIDPGTGVVGETQ